MQFFELFCPCGFAAVERIRQTAPSDIFRQNLLFFRCSLSSVTLQFFQELNCIHVHSELGFRPTHTKVCIGNAEIFRLQFNGRLFFNRLRESLHQTSEILLAFRSEHGVGQLRITHLNIKAAYILNDKSLSIFQIYRITHGVRKIRLLFGLNSNYISFHLLNERIVIELVRIDNHSIFNPTFRKLLTDCHRINVIEAIILFLCIELFVTNQLCNSFLNLRPRQFRAGICSSYGNQHRGCWITAVFLRKPISGFSFTTMIFHVFEHSPFALRIAIPSLYSFVNIVLRNGILCGNFNRSFFSFQLG